MSEPDSVALSLLLRPAEATPLQPFRAHPKSVAVPEQYFEPIARLVAEQKQMAAPGLELEPISHQSVQSIKALSHIRGSNRQVDPGRRSDSKHGLDPFQDRDKGLQRRRVKSRTHLHSSAASQYHVDRIGFWACLFLQLYGNESRSLPRLLLSAFQMPPQRSGT